MSDVCQILHEIFNKLKRICFPFDQNAIPLNGIYVLFERGETAHDGDRIVRIGSHTGKNQLRLRLNQHFVNENKDRSIFRKNIGRALLYKSHNPFLREWDWDLTTRKAKENYEHLIDLEKQKAVETQVTQYLQQQFSFVTFSVNNKDKRLFLESKLISTVSNCEDCRPSSDWLGLSSPKRKIRESGLWQEQHLYKEALSENEIRNLLDLIH